MSALTKSAAWLKRHLKHASEIRHKLLREMSWISKRLTGTILERACRRICRLDPGPLEFFIATLSSRIVHLPCALLRLALGLEPNKRAVSVSQTRKEGPKFSFPPSHKYPMKTCPKCKQPIKNEHASMNFNYSIALAVCPTGTKLS